MKDKMYFINPRQEIWASQQEIIYTHPLLIFYYLIALFSQGLYFYALYVYIVYLYIFCYIFHFILYFVCSGVSLLQPKWQINTLNLEK